MIASSCLTFDKLILLVLVTSINATAVSWGNIRQGQVLVFDQFFNERSSPKENYLEPKDFFFSTRGITISAIHVTDLKGDLGGTAMIERGGVGHTYVKLKLIPNGHKLLLNVEIFGYQDDRYLRNRKK
jgi:hypothetical protein